MRVKYYTEDEWIYPFVMRHPCEMRENLPLIIQLHGAGERGNGKDELYLVERHGFSLVFTEDKEYECILIQPQCPKETFWVADVQSIIKFTQQVSEEFKVDKNRVYLCGLSMGGYGTWYTAMSQPDLFAAIAPCCGGGMPWNAATLKMPVWAFHGSADPVVNVRESIDMIESVKKVNNEAKLTIYENVGHESWELGFSEELLNWLLSKQKQLRSK